MPTLRFRLPAFALATLLSGAAAFGPSPLHAAADDLGVSGFLGYDISWPQCDAVQPGGPFDVAVVGVTDGHPFSLNPCLEQEWDWARQAHTPPAVYLNLNDPPSLGAEPAALVGPRARCAAADPHCAAFDWGFNAANDAEELAARTGVRAQTWWLDVETGDWWSDDPLENSLVIDGAIQALQHRHHTVGVYSSPMQWQAITAGFHPGIPVWTAGADSLDDAPDHCSPDHGFTWGPVRMVQYGAGGFDGDLVCDDHGAPARHRYPAPAPPPPAPAPRAAPAPAPAPPVAAAASASPPGISASVPPPPSTPSPPPPAYGYWMVGADGGVFPVGNAQGFGSVAGSSLNAPVVGIAVTPDDGGYWLAAADGGVFPFGDAKGYGSAAGLPLNAPITGIAATPDGHGYWLVAADGGVFPFGDAQGFGSVAGRDLNGTITAVASTADGHGYWLVAGDGGVFPFGDAQGFGSVAGTSLNAPIVAVATTPRGHGFWLVSADGGVFPFGDAQGYGSAVGVRLNRPVTAIAATADGHGYWLVAGDGGVFPFGDAAAGGSVAGVGLNAPMVAVAASRPDSEALLGRLVERGVEDGV